ncbi:unnamed protein product [Lactuca saligna]|uniref:Uncharacterized protein n=1 Tax=Lactuca saligna TaxID=75948 RepID=A0AA36A4I0_LACSI|nr:unnamed protein product [Lactuca saligna]
MSSSSNSSSPHHHTVIVQLVAATPLRLCHRSRHPYTTDNVVYLIHIGITFSIGSFTEDAIGREGVTMQFVPVNATASRGLEVVVGNLQEYYNGIYITIHFFTYDRFILLFDHDDGL